MRFLRLLHAKLGGNLIQGFGGIGCCHYLWAKVRWSWLAISPALHFHGRRLLLGSQLKLLL